jgi:archaeal flagellar protein FlaJ
LRARLSLLVSLLLAAAFAGLALYEYLSFSSPASPIDQLQRTFLLDASIGGIIGLLYSVAGRIDFLRMSSRKDVTYDLRIPAAVVSASLAAAFAYVYWIDRTGLSFVPVPALLVVVILSLHGTYPFRGTTRVPRIERLTEDRMVKFITSKDRLKRLAEYRAQRFSQLLSQSGEIGNPYIMAAKSITQSIIAAVVLIPVAVILGLLVWSPLIALAAVPAFAYMYPEMHLRDKKGERKEGVERELPFFSILVNVLGSAGVPLYSIFKDVATTKIFSYMKREALLIRRDVTVFGMDPTESFERLASYHPSRKFSTFLYGYTSKVRSGGDIPAYLQGESGSLLRELEESWSRYANRSGIIGSMMVTFFGVIPLLLLIVGFFSSAFSVVGLMVFTAVGMPLLTILLVFVAGRMQPVGEEPLVGSGKRALLLSAPGMVLGFVTGQLWLSFASPLFIFLVVYGFSVREQRNEMKEIDEALPEFMKDVMEFKRQEYDLTRSLLTIAAHNRYNATFDRLLAQIAGQLKTGTPLSEVTADARTRLARMTFFILGQMSLSGGGTVDTVYQLSVYTGKVVEMKQNTQAEMRPYVILSYVTPILLVFGVTFVSGILVGLGNAFTSGAQAAKIQITGVFHPELLQVADILIAGSAAALGVVGAKMSDFTVRNTLRASVNVVIAITATYAATALNVGSLIHVAL